jgi:hypothetical protein
VGGEGGRAQHTSASKEGPDFQPIPFAVKSKVVVGELFLIMQVGCRCHLQEISILSSSMRPKYRVHERGLSEGAGGGSPGVLESQAGKELSWKVFCFSWV